MRRRVHSMSIASPQAGAPWDARSASPTARSGRAMASMSQSGARYMTARWGAPVDIPQDLEARLPAVQAELYRGRELVDRGVAANVLGSPLAALAHLVDVLAKQPHTRTLVAGEIVSTGTITDAHPVTAGETW